MHVLVIAAFVAVAVADIRPLNLNYGFPQSSYQVPHGSITASPNFYGFYQTSPSPNFRLPIHEPQNFGAQISNIGSFGLSTPGPFVGSGIQFTTPAPALDVKNEIVSSTPAPSVEVSSAGFSTPSPIGVEISSPSSPISLGSFESSTAAPIAGFSSAGFSTASPFIGSSSFGFSTPAPSHGLASSTPAPTFLNSLGFGSNPSFNFGLAGFSTPAPLTQFGSGSLTPIDSSIFNNDAALNGFQATTSGGSLLEAFGGPTVAPTYTNVEVSAKGAPEVQRNVYFYAAPDDQEPIRPRVRIATPATDKKNINYIFIKAPAPAPIGPIRVQAPIKQEDKTVVYVLVKKPDENQEIEIQTPEPQPTQKPEVFFIKYKTQQEAEEAVSKVQSGQTSPSEHITAENLSGSSSFISNLGKVNYNIQPIVSQTKYSNIAQPFSNINSGLFYSTTAAPNLSNDFSISTFAPSFNAFTASTPAPIFNTFSQDLPKLGSFSQDLPKLGSLLGSSFSNGAIPDVKQNVLDAQFSSSTIAPETFVSSTIEPSAFGSRFFKTASNSPFSVYGPPLIKKKK